MQPTPVPAAVLIVDDDEGIRELLRQWCEDLGYHAYPAADAEQALALMERVPIQSAICDVRLGHRSGLWLADEIRTRHPGIGIVFATGLSELDPAITLSPHVVGYLVKPFSRRRFAAALESASLWAGEATILRQRQLSGPVVDGEVC